MIIRLNYQYYNCEQKWKFTANLNTIKENVPEFDPINGLSETNAIVHKPSKSLEGLAQKLGRLSRSGSSSRTVKESAAYNIGRLGTSREDNLAWMRRKLHLCSDNFETKWILQREKFCEKRNFQHETNRK